MLCCVLRNSCQCPWLSKCVKEVCSFHSFCNFHCPFIAGFSKIALPLNALTKKHCETIWTDAAQHAFNKLKTRIMQEPILIHPDLTKQFELEVDVSGYTIRVVLTQWPKDSKRHPVGYYSITLSPAEQNCQEAALTRRTSRGRSREGVELGLSGKQLHPATPELTAWQERPADSSQ